MFLDYAWSALTRARDFDGRVPIKAPCGKKTLLRNSSDPFDTIPEINERPVVYPWSGIHGTFAPTLMSDFKLKSRSNEMALGAFTLNCAPVYFYAAKKGARYSDIQHSGRLNI